MQAHPNQLKTYIQADVSSYPEKSEERAQTDFSFPVFFRSQLEMLRTKNKLPSLSIASASNADQDVWSLTLSNLPSSA
jgi:hypothetical protein